MEADGLAHPPAAHLLNDTEPRCPDGVGWGVGGSSAVTVEPSGSRGASRRPKRDTRGVAVRREAREPAPPSVGVIDVGSNSGRISVIEAGAGGHLEIIADARFPLRLVHWSAAQGRLGDAAVARVAEALRAFLAIARSAGAPVVAVATAAVRESTNRREFVGRVASETGVRLEILDGDAEARYMFAGAVHGLPVSSAWSSTSAAAASRSATFGDRRPLRQWTLPLGALRLSDRFLVTDPPRPSEQGRLRQHVLATIAGAGVPPLRPGEQLVGTGGTLRNLAKIDRARRTYPITRLHGYQPNRADLDVAVDTLAARPMTRRRRVTGLSDERADSIVGGALCAQVLLDTLSADHLVLSGRGLREGVALERLGLQVRSAPEVRRSSVEALARRFATWDRAAASSGPRWRRP